VGGVEIFAAATPVPTKNRMDSKQKASAVKAGAFRNRLSLKNRALRRRNCPATGRNAAADPALISKAHFGGVFPIQTQTT